LKGLRIIALFLLAYTSTTKAYTQSYLEFVENKGQWEKDISFKGMMVNGAFALKPDGGYKMLLNNTKDMQAIHDYYHGEANNKTSANTTFSKIPSGGNGNSENLVLHSHMYDVKFLNANANPVPVAEKPLTTYNNYFIGNDKSKWAPECKIYQAITYKNIYPNIDVRYYTGSGYLKYDLIVHPGGDVNNIALYFDGVDGLKIKDGSLIIKTSVDEVKEAPPYSYQTFSTGKKELQCHFEIKGNIVRFKFDGEYAKNATLIIDPQLIFSTFTGSTADNWGYTATYDNVGNFYAGGIVFNRSGSFPVSPGAFQTSFGGGASGSAGAFDIAIMKFSPNGSNRMYATYLGGSGNEQPHSLVVNANQELVVAGRTTSTNYPSTQPLFGSGGQEDIILTKFNASGTALIGSRVFGGTGNDGVNIRDKESTPTGQESLRRNYGDDARSEVILDASGNICLASCTQSIDFPTTANAFQSASGGNTAGNGRIQDAVFIKTTPDLSNVLACSYLGGGGDDAAFVLAINPATGNFYLAGATASGNFPGDKTGTLFPTNQGGIDGFVSIISSDGSQLIKTSYFGTSGIDIIYGIQFDRFNYPYIMGTTTGSWTVTPASIFNQAGGKQFISKLDQGLTQWQYSTVFGTNQANPNLSPTAFLVDRCENVYVSGWGGVGNSENGYPSAGTTGLSITSDAVQRTTDGSDFYFFVLEKNGQSQLYGSYFGQNRGLYPDHVDGGTSRFDRNGIIYQSICGNCGGGTVFPTTAGVWSQTNGAGAQGCNLAAIKIAFNLAGIGADIQASVRGMIRDTSGCVPLTADFTDLDAMGKKYIWSFSDGSPDVTTDSPKVSHTFNNIGIYRVRLVSIDSASCNIADTAYVNMRVRNDEAILALNAAKIGACNSLTYQFNNNSIPPSGKPFKSNSFRISFGDGTSQITGTQVIQHTYPSTGIYNVTLTLLDTNYCNYPDSIPLQIRLADNVKALFATPTTGCSPYTATFENKSTGGLEFIWDFGDGNTSTQINPTHQYQNPGSYVVMLVANDSASCNKTDTARLTIIVSSKPAAAFNYTPVQPIANTATTFNNLSSGAVRYKWLWGDGDSLITTSTNPVNYIFGATQTYNTCLIAVNAAGCSDTTCQDVRAIVVPAAAVPNAFSPNGDGSNEKIYVRGFGIAKMQWQIYNRWGTLVYTSADKSQGWDGTYKGVLQPQDVYHYVLQIEFSDNTKYSTKGDITLLR
jgi:gliding motility-associated-like protein